MNTCSTNLTPRVTTWDCYSWFINEEIKKKITCPVSFLIWRGWSWLDWQALCTGSDVTGTPYLWEILFTLISAGASDGGSCPVQAAFWETDNDATKLCLKLNKPKQTPDPGRGRLGDEHHQLSRSEFPGENLLPSHPPLLSSQPQCQKCILF